MRVIDEDADDTVNASTLTDSACISTECGLAGSGSTRSNKASSTIRVRAGLDFTKTSGILEVETDTFGDTQTADLEGTTENVGDFEESRNNARKKGFIKVPYISGVDADNLNGDSGSVRNGM